MQARIAELDAGKSAENPATETAANDFENWSNDQLKSIWLVKILVTSRQQQKQNFLN